MPFPPVVFLLIGTGLLGAAVIVAIRQHRRPPIWSWALAAGFVLLLAALIFMDPVKDLSALWWLLAGVVAVVLLAAGSAIAARWGRRPRVGP